MRTVKKNLTDSNNKIALLDYFYIHRRQPLCQQSELAVTKMHTQSHNFLPWKQDSFCPLSTYVEQKGQYPNRQPLSGPQFIRFPEKEIYSYFDVHILCDLCEYDSTYILDKQLSTVFWQIR